MNYSGRICSFLVFLQATFYCQAAFSSEVDSFNASQVQLKDASKLLNQEINRRLKLAAMAANDYQTCSKERLRTEVRFRVGEASIIGVGDFEKFIDENPKIDKFKIPWNRSIYRDVKFFDSLALHIYGLGTVIRVGRYLVGSDKFGHFFWDGWKYYHKAYNLNQGVIGAMNYGESTEEGLFGYLLTGIYSYADLAVNLNGMRFYMDLVGEQESLSMKFARQGPLFKCVKNKWVQTRNFKWSDYVDASWDETINCNQYRTQSFEESVQRRVAQLDKRGTKLTCPLRPLDCREMKRKYLMYASRVLHPNCYNYR